MMDYFFFDERLWRDFIDYLRQLGLEPEIAQKKEGWLVYLPEDLDEELDDKIESRYEQLFEMNEYLVVEPEGREHMQVAGINVTLSDGRVVQAAIDPGLMNRLLDAVSTDELGELASAIADVVEHPDRRFLFQR